MVTTPFSRFGCVIRFDQYHKMSYNTDLVTE